MYVPCLIIFIVASLAARLAFIDSYPFGFSGHAVTHATLRLRLYDAIFVSPWNQGTWRTVRDIFLQEQHGPQSLVEALLSPIFGFGFTESRLIVGTVGLLSLVLIVAWGTVALNRWFGLLAGLTIGMAPYALYFSRNGDSEHVLIYLQGFLLLFAAQRSIQRGFVRDYALLGFAAGSSLYVYATNQMLCGLVVGLVALFQLGPLMRSGWKSAGARIFAFGLTALAIAEPMIEQHLRVGRTLFLRTPYGTPNYEFANGQDIPSRVVKLWRDLFVQGGDAWFARTHGSLNDYTLLLLIPGLVMMIALLRKDCGSRTRSVYFLCAITVALIFIGGIPAVLSPEPVFRRAVLLALGLDMLKALGCYGLALMALRYTPKYTACGIVFLLAVAYGTYDWKVFFFNSHAHESNGGNSTVATIRYVRNVLASGKDAVILLPQERGLLDKNDFTFFLRFDLGSPKQLPASIRMIELADLASAPLLDVIVPFVNYQRISSKSVALPDGIEASNPRIFSNRHGETFALVDFVRSASPS